MRRSANDHPSLLDLQMLNELRMLETGSPSFLRDLVSEFLESCESELTAIGECLEANDPDRVWSLAHGLKGACFMVGAKQLGEAVTRLEIAARAKDLAAANAQIPSIRRVQRATREALLALL